HCGDLQCDLFTRIAAHIWLATDHRARQSAPATPGWELWRNRKDRQTGQLLQHLARVHALVEIFPHKSDAGADAEAGHEGDPEEQQSRRPALVARRGRLRNDAGVRAVDRLLFTGFPRAYQKRLIDRAARLDLTLKFAQLNGSLVGRVRA